MATNKQIWHPTYWADESTGTKAGGGSGSPACRKPQMLRCNWVANHTQPPRPLPVVPEEKQILQGRRSLSPTGLQSALWKLSDPGEGPSLTRLHLRSPLSKTQFFGFPSCLTGVHLRLPPSVCRSLCQSHTSSPLYTFDDFLLPSRFVPVSLIWGESWTSSPTES